MMHRSHPPVQTVDEGFIQTVATLAGSRRGLLEFLSFSESMLGAVGIGSQQYQTLLIVIRSGDDGVPIGSLAKELLLVLHGAVQIVNKLADL
jgi:hypothetical protein